eukprot:376347-Pyramimonas_sp.AAC.1
MVCQCAYGILVARGKSKIEGEMVRAADGNDRCWAQRDDDSTLCTCTRAHTEHQLHLYTNFDCHIQLIAQRAC